MIKKEFVTSGIFACIMVSLFIAGFFWRFVHIILAFMSTVTIGFFPLSMVWESWNENKRRRDETINTLSKDLQGRAARLHRRDNASIPFI